MQARLLTAALAGALLLPASVSASDHAVTGECYDMVVANSDPEPAAATVVALVVSGSANHLEEIPLVYVTCTVKTADGTVVHQSYGGMGARPDVVVLPGVGYQLCTSSSAYWLVYGDRAEGPSGCKPLVG